jgi:protein-S-isoprenylcysteine O-methyltransferase Ste14
VERLAAEGDDPQEAAQPGDGGSPTDPFDAKTVWDVPDDFGAAAAIQNIGTVAAPLLAGFSFTLLTLVVQNPGNVARPDLTLLLLVGAGLAMIFTVQFGAWARQLEARPSDYREWWPDADDDRGLVREHSRAARQHARWASRTRLSYNIGILLLLAAVVVLLLPPGDSVSLASARGWAVVVAIAGLLGEAAWLLRVKISAIRDRR